MKTFIPAAIRCSLMFTAVAALSLAYPASVQAVPTTYQYTGNPFTVVSGPYTTSDFVTAMVTLAGPLGANMPLTNVTPTAFTLTDGVQTISNLNATFAFFQFATDATGSITAWRASVGINGPPVDLLTETENGVPFGNFDRGGSIGTPPPGPYAFNIDNPGQWTVNFAVPDAGSSISLMTLTFMALGVAAQRFKRAAA